MRISLDRHSGEEFPLTGLSHGSILKLALLCLLLGGVCLAAAEFIFWSSAEARPEVARFAEFFGWSSLIFSTAVLLVGWREHRRETRFLRGVLFDCLKRTDPWALNSKSQLNGSKRALCVVLPPTDEKREHVPALYMYFDPFLVKDDKNYRKGLENEENRQAQIRAKRIDDLYSELRPLMSRAVVEPNLEEDVHAKLSLLRELQEEEADEMEKRFKASLLLKPGEGRQALERARELLARYEDPSIKNSSA